MFVMALDGQPVAFTAPHGQRLEWLENPLAQAGFGRVQRMV
jgi:hypothetical protein